MKKSTLSVSRKFHKELTERIISASAAAGIDSGELISAVNAYITGAVIPDRNASPSLLLAFTLLRPEIDKAKERSLRARQRRKPTAAATSGQSSPELDESPVLMNRRQRRLLEQQLRRAKRKLTRRKTTESAGLPAKGIRRKYKENDSIVA